MWDVGKCRFCPTESPGTLCSLTSVSLSHSLQGKMASFASSHHLLPRITSSFLFDWHDSLGLTVILGIHTVTFGYSYFRLSCVQLFIQQKWWIFSFSEILPSYLSLSAAGDTKAPGFNLAHLHSREQKRKKKKTRCVFFISHSSNQKNRLIFMCYFITLIKWAQVLYMTISGVCKRL